MQVSVDQNHITVTKSNSIERYAISHIRKTQKIIRHFRHDNDEDIWVRIKILSFVSVSCFVVFYISEAAPAFIIFLICSAALAYFVYDVKTNDKYKPTFTTLYWGFFMSGDNEKYSLVSRKEAEIDEFLGAISSALSETLVKTYNFHVDNSVNSSDINIREFVNKAGAEAIFYEGAVPPEDNETRRKADG
ncbi:hypothetical protein [Afifella marina]|uniref:Uncharacterized protein n=1 Tax=Afifella marina DSM 2698 TaxID=1120955 RepID=A0A1G5NIT8_AFIMA|nr:hypothetical protein [Afifella marina]SCZ37325.1 hypothetical protein SAMN03080610_02151 [Afifella marina DSM 2698]